MVIVPTTVRAPGQTAVVVQGSKREEIGGVVIDLY